VPSTSTAGVLKGQKALVTGAAGILGRVFCCALRDAGCEVIGVDIDGDRVNDACGTGVRAVSVDLSSEADIVGLARTLESESSVPDILVNNAGSKSSRPRDFFVPFENASVSVWDEVMAVNLRAPMILAREIGGRLVATGRTGSIINIASIYGVVAPDPRIYEGSDYPELGGAISTPAVYSASKAGLIGLTRYLAAYWGRAGIRVNAISPGGIASGQNETFTEKYSARAPMGRMARASEMTGALLYLASADSSYVTGQNIVVDGGLTAW
jgi:NAD(P)-dependent dehydrogenase (short-subunit alcohol dehydrogenase family)